jgi:NAD(P)-dependent dehydrogenase (short-subunit alcohol dehydrogenase family)
MVLLTNAFKFYNIAFIKCDVGLREEVKSACEKVLNDFKKVDILVLNAGMEFTEAINEIDPVYFRYSPSI